MGARHLVTLMSSRSTASAMAIPSKVAVPRPSSSRMTSEREEVIDFVAPYFDQSGISIILR